MARNPEFYISLFAGAGGLDLALRIAKPEARCVLAVEIEIPATGILASRMADGSLHETPVWSDVRSVPVELYRGRVDGIVGGFPCQDLSVAGKREGIGGKRSGLFEEYARLIAELKPGWVFIENVSGLVSSLTLLHNGEIMEHLDGLLAAADAAETPKERWYIQRHHERLHRRLLKQYGIPALLYVQCRLEAMGYLCQTGFFTAAEVGGSHRRERVFILAHSEEYRRREGRAESARQQGRPDANERCRAVADAGDGRNGTGSAGAYLLGHADEPGPQGRRMCGCGCADERAVGAAGVESVADAGGAGLPQRAGSGSNGGALQQTCGAIAPGSGIALFPPGPGDAAAWQRILAEHPHLAPAVEPGVRVLADGVAVVVDAARTDQLRAGGNGVMALAGAAAFIELARRAGL